MRWVDEYLVKGCAGQERIRSGFLWFPKELQGEYRWLERASWVERYGNLWTVYPNGWHAYRWAPCLMT